MSCSLLSMIRLGMPAGREHGPGSLLTVGVAIETASTVVSVPLRHIVSKPDHGGSCLSFCHENIETLMLPILPRTQGMRSGLGHSGREPSQQ